MNKETKIWLITDTHFNHKKLIEYGRPADFEERLKENLKKVVKPEDILIHIGDVCIGLDVENNNWFKQNLGCRTWLLLGNHDTKSMTFYLNNGWDFVGKRLDIEMYGKRIAISHYPLAWDGYFDKNIHGHFHDTDMRRQTDFQDVLSGYNKLLAVEFTDYKPVLLKDF